MDPHRTISNSIVKGYSGENTKRGAFWENNTMSKLLFHSHYIFCVEKKINILIMLAWFKIGMKSNALLIYFDYWDYQAIMWEYGV